MSRVVRYGAYAIGGLVLLVLAAVLILPQLLDRPRMAAELQARLSRAVQGEVRWQQFSVRILPYPQGVLRGLEVKSAAATITTEEATAALRLWPLLLGRAEIASVKVVRPVVRLTVVPAAAVPEEAQLAPAPTNPLEAYRSAVRGVADALQNFAPDTVLEVADADLNVRVEGMPPIEVSKLAVAARTNDHGVELEAGAASRYWNALKLTASVNYADLSSTADLQLTRIQGKAWLDWVLKESGIELALPDVDLSLRFRGDAAKALELDVEGGAKTIALARGAKTIAASPLELKAKVVADASDVAVQVSRLGVGASALAGGAVRFTPKDRSLAGDVGYDLDLPQALGYARQFLPQPLGRVESFTGTLHGRVQVSLRGDDRRIGVTIEKSDAALQVKELPGPVRLTQAAVEVDAKAVSVKRAAVSMPAGNLRLTSARYAFKDGSAAAAVDYDLGLAPTLALVRAALPKESRASLDIVESAEGRMRGAVKGTLSGKNWAGALELTQSDARAHVKGVPGAVTLVRASARATPKVINVDRATVSLLDATATASAILTNYTGDMRVQASVADATIGPKAIAWGWQRAKIPPNLELKAPIRVSVPHFAWARKSPLQVRAEARFESGPTVGADVAWSPEMLAVHRASIKDRMSDMTLGVTSRGGVIEGSYSGTLDSRTIAAMLKSAKAPAGAMEGKLRFTFVRADRTRNSVEGTLKGDNVDLSWLAGAPAAIEHLDVSADGDALHIGDSSMHWAGQRVTVRGDIKRGPKGPVIEASLESPGVLVDALLPKKPAAAPAKPPAKEEKAPDIWPLPVTGKISVRSQFVQYTHFKVQPLSANIVLEDDRAVLDVQEALVCGFAVPLTVAATPKGFTAKVQIAAQQQKLEEAAQCLAGEHVALSGAMDLRADLRTQGMPSELVRNLQGTVNADVRKGMVMKFALIGNILSLQNVVAVVQGGPKLGAEGFPFRQLAAKGRFEKGRFVLDEGVFYSDAVGLGANGWISLTDYQTRLTVLVAPLALLNEGVRKLPLLGYVVGGTLTSLPVAVSGDIRDPLVVPLGPGAITNELTGIVSRTLSLPGKALGK